MDISSLIVYILTSNIGLHIVGSGICALFEMHAETAQKRTHEIQSETLVSLHRLSYGVMEFDPKVVLSISE